MTDEKIDYFKRIQKAKERLATLPNDHKKKAEYEIRFKRAAAYFDWWVRDEFAVNSWRAEKQLKALQAEMGTFKTQYQLLDSEKELDETHLNFVERVSESSEKLSFLSRSLEQSLVQSSQKLLQQVDDAMQTQLTEIGQYLLASREALARVSDSLLVEGKIRYIDSEADSDNRDKNIQNMEGSK